MKKTLFLTISILPFFFLLASPVKAQCVRHHDTCTYSGEACCDYPSWQCSDGTCEICGHSSREPCCGEPQVSGYCLELNVACRWETHRCCVTNGNNSNSVSDCCSGCRNANTGVCIVCPAPTSTAAGGEEGGIDFGGLSGAIPSLKPIFQAGPASNVGEIISTIIPYLFVLAGLLLLFYLIYGGFHMMIAAGNEKGLAQAKGKISNALIGFLLLFISYWLVQVIEFVLGIKIF